MTIFLFWILIGIFFIAIDIYTSGFLFASFSMGALLSAFLSSKISILGQVIVFLITGILIILIAYPKIKLSITIHSKGDTDAYEKLKTSTFIAPEDIDANIEQRLKVKDSYWTVIANKNIKKGEKFIVYDAKNTKLFIKKKESEEN